MEWKEDRCQPRVKRTLRPPSEKDGIGDPRHLQEKPVAEMHAEGLKVNGLSGVT